MLLWQRERAAICEVVQSASASSWFEPMGEMIDKLDAMESRIAGLTEHREAAQVNLQNNEYAQVKEVLSPLAQYFRGIEFDSCRLSAHRDAYHDPPGLVNA